MFKGDRIIVLHVIQGKSGISWFQTVFCHGLGWDTLLSFVKTVGKLVVWFWFCICWKQWNVCLWERDRLGECMCQVEGKLKPVVCSCCCIRVKLLGSDGNLEETSFEDFLLENAQHHPVTGNFSLGWKSCVSATLQIDSLSFTYQEIPLWELLNRQNSLRRTIAVLMMQEP